MNFCKIKIRNLNLLIDSLVGKVYYIDMKVKLNIEC